MDASGLETRHICIHENAISLPASFPSAGGRTSDIKGNENSRLISTQLISKLRHVHLGFQAALGGLRKKP